MNGYYKNLGSFLCTRPFCGKQFSCVETTIKKIATYYMITIVYKGSQFDVPI